MLVNRDAKSEMSAPSRPTLYAFQSVKNLKLFSIRVNELFKPIVLRKTGDGFLLFLKAFS